jgi:hypothetical protein
LKSSEIMSLKELEGNFIETITPFFDYAQRDDLTEEKFVLTAEKLAKSLRKNAIGLRSMYLDNFDIDTNFEVLGKHNYEYLLDVFNEFDITPVVSIDRSAAHTAAVCSAKDNGVVTSNNVALRLTPEYFLNFHLVKDDIEDELGDVLSRFDAIDLILDCRVCLRNDPNELSNNISSFILEFVQVYETDKIIVTGSSIPASIRDITGTDTQLSINRIELDIFNKTLEKVEGKIDLTLGDYATVSPNYSDVDIPGGAMRNITAPKIIYSYENKHYVSRGEALQTHPLGNGQYAIMTQTLLGEPFFRGDPYSWGDSYLGQKSRAEGSQATPTTMVKPLCNAHINFMYRSYA